LRRFQDRLKNRDSVFVEKGFNRHVNTADAADLAR
jgi:hypothetical protein